MNQRNSDFGWLSQKFLFAAAAALQILALSHPGAQPPAPVQETSALAEVEAALDRDLTAIQEASKNAPPMTGTYTLHERKTKRHYGLNDAPDPFAPESATITGLFREVPSEGMFELRGASYDRPDKRAGRVVEKFFLLFDNGHVSSRRLWRDPVTRERMGMPRFEDSSQQFSLPDEASGPASGRWIAASFLRQRFSGRTPPKVPGITWVTSDRSLDRIEEGNKVVYLGSHKIGFPKPANSMRIDERLEISLDANPRILSYTATSSWPHVSPDRPFSIRTVSFEYVPVSDGTMEFVVLGSIRSEETYIGYNEAGVPSISEPDSTSVEVFFSGVRVAPETRSEELEFIGTKLPLHRSNRPVNR